MARRPRNARQLVTAKPITPPVLDAAMIKGFSKLYLESRYPDLCATPLFHYEVWTACCSDHPKVVIAAPRGHCKSTAVTKAYLLATLLFRVRSHAMIISDTEAQASLFLGDLKVECQENEQLIADFEISRVDKDCETELIVAFMDGHKFRVTAKGSEQKMLGVKWLSRRPDIVIGDDLENGEIVESPTRREKFRYWFLRTLMPMGSKDCLFRVVGTVKHMDAMLNRLLNTPSWRALKYEAHNPDYSSILWPENFPKERLLAIQQEFLDQNDLEGYAMEFLNNPVPEGATFFRRSDFIPMEEEEIKKTLQVNPSFRYVAAADFAISENQRSDYTVVMVAAVDEAGLLYIIDVRFGRWDSDEIIDALITVQKRYQPDIFTFETEKIDKALGPFLDRQMLKERAFININRETPTKSKVSRAKSIQGMMKSGSVRFNKSADWYSAVEAQLMSVTPSGPKGSHDDFFDAFAYIGLSVHKYTAGKTIEEIEEDDYDNEFGYDMTGVSAVCGY